MSYFTKAAKSNGACPHCGQPMPQIRCGVRMYPQTARIFDVIRSAGRAGIDGHALQERAYAGARKPKYNSLSTHIEMIRSFLADTDYTIECTRVGRNVPGVYRLVKVVQVKAFEAVF